jgi:8-oxo-dGTP pyrophosphatase MutT (NUDIX family)
MGKERFGRYRGKWNLCAGSVEECDIGCLVAAACRELREEFKLDIQIERWPLYVRKCIWLAQTVVFIIKPPVGLDVLHLDTVNALTLRDAQRADTEKEMETIQWIALDRVPNMPVSALARYILKKHLKSEEVPPSFAHAPA